MTSSDVAAELARLRGELDHRDQLLAAVCSRADTLQHAVERLERQIDAAIEAQRAATTERAELRRLLGNAQLQVHALLQLPAPEGEQKIVITERRTPAEAAPPPAEPATEPPPAADAPPETSPPPPAPAARPPAEPRRPAQRGGLVDEARAVWSNLRRLI